MPTVGIDCRFGSALAGLGTFTRSLTAALLQRTDPWDYVLFVKSNREAWLQSLPAGVRTHEAPFDHYSFGEQTGFPNVIQDSACDLFLSPHFNVPLMCPVPFVCTVHDLILHRFRSEAPLRRHLMYRFVLGRALRGAKNVLTVSKATLQDLESHFSRSVRAKSVVAYPGVDPTFKHQSESVQSDVRSRYGLKKPFFLYVGNCKEHKNVQMLIDAFIEAGLPTVASAKAGLPGVELCIVAGGRECAYLQRQPGVRFLPLVPLEDLPALYSSALACVTATLMEGFCLPLIEAMACRCPVIATATGAISEICGRHALLVEPRTRPLSDAMRSVLSNPKLITSVTLDDAERFSHVYSWEHTAEVTAGVLSKLLPFS